MQCLSDSSHDKVTTQATMKFKWNTVMTTEKKRTWSIMNFMISFCFSKKNIGIQLVVSDVKFYRATKLMHIYWWKHFCSPFSHKTRRCPRKRYFHPKLSLEEETETWKLSQWHAAVSPNGPLHHSCSVDITNGGRHVRGFWKVMEDTCGSAKSTLKSMMWGMATGRRRWCSERCTKGF